MHESIPVDSLLATRLDSGYYTTLPESPFPKRAPWVQKGAAMFANPMSKEERDWGEAQVTRLSEEFRADLIATLRLQNHHAGAAVVAAAEQTAKEWGEAHSSGCEACATEYDIEAPLDAEEMKYAADVAARFAVFLT